MAPGSDNLNPGMPSVRNGSVKSLARRIARRLTQPFTTWRQRVFARRFASHVGETNNCYISQNCVGGRFYELEGRAYSSPTVGLWFTPPDFLQLCENLAGNLAAEIHEDLAASARVGYPVGNLNGIRIWFQHYPTFEAARMAWHKRAARVAGGDIFIVMTDRDGFSADDFDRFMQLPMAKLLLSHKALPHEEVVLIPGYKGEVGDLYASFERLDSPASRERLFRLLRPNGP